jgi:hypothetical protein
MRYGYLGKNATGKMRGRFGITLELLNVLNSFDLFEMSLVHALNYRRVGNSLC